MDAGYLFDLLVATFILALGRGAVSARSVFRAVVFFVAFGLTMGLAWTRLGAPDVALAEIAVGAGLTGALFMAAARSLGRSGDDDE